MANRIVRGLGWTTASSVIRNLVHLLQLVVLTRFLERADFGIVAIAHLFVSFTAMFLDMGMSVGIIHKQKVSNEEYSSLFWLNIFLGTFLTIGLYVIAPYITAGYSSEDLTKVVQLLCVTIFLSALGTQQRTYCQKQAYFARLAIIEIIGAIITLGIAVLTAVKGYGVYSLAYSTIAGAVFMNIIHLVIGLYKDCHLRLHFSLSETFPFLKIGIYQIGAAIIDFITRELDIIIISAMLGLEFLGVYNIAKRVPTAIYSFIQPIVVRVFTPLLAEMQENKNALKNNYMKLSKALSWISFPVYLFLAAISPTVIAIVFGVSYIDGVPVMMAFCLRYAFNGVNGVCGALQTATGRTDIGFKWTICLIITTAIVYYISASLGITAFLIGICALTFVLAIQVWYIQFKPMVCVTFMEYMTIYSRSFFISFVLASFVYLAYSSPSILYSTCSLVVFCILYTLLLLKSDDGKEVKEAMIMMNMPVKVISIVEKIKKSEM